MQPTFFDNLERGLTIQERFERFDELHPDVYALFKRFAFELRRAGRNRCGAKMIAERIRWSYATSSAAADDWKLNNVFVSRYARKLIAECPEFEGFFELRTLKAP